jgi:hypothetical protein
MSKPDPAPNPQADPDQDRATRRDRVLARLVEIQMEVAEATRTEAVERPVAGVDYCGRLAVIARSVRLTLLLEEKASQEREEQEEQDLDMAHPPPAGMDPSWHHLRVKLAVAGAIYAGSATEAEAARRCKEAYERMDRPEQVEMIERCPAPVAVLRLCRRFGLPPEIERWLAMGDDVLKGKGAIPDPKGPVPNPATGGPPRPRPAGYSRPRPPPDTG